MSRLSPARSVVRTGRGPLRAGRLGDGTSPLGRAVAGLAVAGALALAVLAAVLVLGRGRTTLDDLRLAGARGPQCVRTVVAVDLSGSMSDAATQRDAAVAQLLRWLPGNLRPDDEVALVAFAAQPGPVAGPFAPDRLGSATLPAPAGDGRSTAWQPVLDAVAGLAPSGCDTALLVVSDAQLDQVPDDPDAARAGLRAARVHDLTLLVPSEELEVPAAWARLYPSAPPVRVDGSDPRATALALARCVAASLGQRLVEAPGRA